MEPVILEEEVPEYIGRQDNLLIIPMYNLQPG
jgi:hypothetical protein